MFRRVAPVVLVALLAAGADLSGGLTPLENALRDLRMTAAPRAPSGKVVLVDIDAQSLAAVGRWPWVRSIDAAIVDRLREGGASDIVLDIDFSAASSPAGDAALEAALTHAGGSVIVPAFQQRATGVAGSAVVQTVPLKRFADHAWVASVNVRPDADGQIRRVGYGDIIEGAVVPSLSSMLGGQVGSAEKEFLVDYSIDPARLERISAIDLLDGKVVAERVAGKKVIVGANAVELRDFFQVPVYGVVSGTTVQALAVESLLQSRMLARSGPAVTLAGLALVALSFLFVLGRVRWMTLVGLIFAAGCLVEGAATLVQWHWPFALNTAPWQATLIAFGVVVLIREIDFRHILLLISRTETRNTRTILDRIVYDNFAGVLVVDEAGSVLAASRMAEDILSQRPLVGRRAADVLPPEFLSAIAHSIAARKAGARRHSNLRELNIHSAAGEHRILEYVVTPSPLAGGVSVEGRSVADAHIACLTFSDVTDRRLAAVRMEKLARFDTLTGLPNRNEFMERLGAALAAVMRDDVAVICLDLDRFRNVNDTLGHNVGDLLLSAMARRLESLSGSGDMVARFGGDNYAMLLVGNDAMARAAALADALIARVGEPFQLGVHRRVAGVSVGVAGSDGVKDPLVILKQADTALYRAKEGGGNRWMRFASAMIAGFEARQELELALWEALERGEFMVFYQPQVDLADGRIVGVEALLRWDHPQRGDIPPAEFIPVAEAAGLIQPLGEWVLHTACNEVARWPDPVRLAINVSSVQFARGDIVSAVADALARSGLAADRLELEITESLLMTENSGAAKQIEALRAMGVRFALDDFGTGYSSLGYITRFPIGKIKLDHSFISGIPHDKAAVSVVQAVGLLASNLGIQLNAEGIEQAEQVELLRLLGCKEGQGFLFGRAMPAEALVGMLPHGAPAKRQRTA